MHSVIRRRLVPTLAAFVALGLGGAALAQNPSIEARKLPATGKSRTCLDAQDVGTVIPTGDRSLLFNVTGNKWYRNDLNNACALLSEEELPNHLKGLYMHSQTEGKYCASDRFTVIDNTTIVWLGQCTLGDFTPVAAP